MTYQGYVNDVSDSVSSRCICCEFYIMCEFYIVFLFTDSPSPVPSSVLTGHRGSPSPVPSPALTGHKGRGARGRGVQGRGGRGGSHGIGRGRGRGTMRVEGNCCNNYNV